MSIPRRRSSLSAGCPPAAGPVPKDCDARSPRDTVPFLTPGSFYRSARGKTEGETDDQKRSMAESERDREKRSKTAPSKESDRKAH